MKLSVLTTTYNSSSFVEKTIRGVLAQQINFDCEYIISDDASQDDTEQVVKGIIRNHPRGSIIKFYKNEENQGVMRNFFGGLKKCSGKYVAFCDSDDYWQDPGKLQRQVEYLDDHSSCVLTYHPLINIPVEKIAHVKLMQFDEPINRLILRPQTSTLVVRNVLKNIPDRLIEEIKGPQNDQLLRFLLSEHGDFQYLKDIKPTIRTLHSNNIYSTVNRLQKKSQALQSWQVIYDWYKGTKHEPLLRKKVIMFKGSVNWLRLKSMDQWPAKVHMFFDALAYDLKSGRGARKMVQRLRKIIFYPYRRLKNI